MCCHPTNELLLCTAEKNPDGSPGGPGGAAAELKNSDLHKLSENSWLQFCRDARMLGDSSETPDAASLMPTEACLIFTSVNTRRAARNRDHQSFVSNSILQRD